MKFTTRNGLELEYDDSETEAPVCTEVTILGEARDNRLTIRDSHGTEAVIGKEILAANGIASDRATITLGPGLYARHFGDPARRRYEAAAGKLQCHFARLVEQRELILSRPGFFLLRLPGLCSAGSPGVRVAPCLGGLLETFGEPGPLRLDTAPEHGPLHVLCVTGSVLSGACHVLCWSGKERRLLWVGPGAAGHDGRPRAGGEPAGCIEAPLAGFGHYFALLKAIAGRYPYKLANEHLRMEALVREARVDGRL